MRAASRADVERFALREPPALTSPLHFFVDSGLTAPHLAGPIEVLASEKGIEVRWLGSDEPLLLLQWGELMVFADKPSDGFQKYLSELYENEKEKGYKEGVLLADTERKEQLEKERKLIRTKLTCTTRMLTGGSRTP